MRLMTDQRIRHLPVVEGAAIVGIVSIGDLVRSLIYDSGRDDSVSAAIHQRTLPELRTAGRAIRCGGCDQVCWACRGRRASTLRIDGVRRGGFSSSGTSGSAGVSGGSDRRRRGDCGVSAGAGMATTGGGVM